MSLQCPYCTGNGYFQLITGGSETCPSCLGTGIEKQEILDEEASSYQTIK